MHQLILLVIALPFVSAVLTQLFSDRLGRNPAFISIVGSWATLLLAIGTLWLAISEPGVHEFSLMADWGIIRFDSLSTLMCVLIAAISLIVNIYSQRYMVEEAGYARFFVLLGCFW